MESKDFKKREVMSYKRFHIPKTKLEVLNWLIDFFKSNPERSKGLRGKSKEELLEMYFAIRIKED
jgi:hypothetical protein